MGFRMEVQHVDKSLHGGGRGPRQTGYRLGNGAQHLRGPFRVEIASWLICKNKIGKDRTFPDEKISTTLRQPDLQQSVNELIKAANQNGGKDNITVVILEMPQNGGVKKMWENLHEIQPQAAVSYAGLVIMILAVLAALIMVVIQLIS